MAFSIPTFSLVSRKRHSECSQKINQASFTNIIMTNNALILTEKVFNILVAAAPTLPSMAVCAVGGLTRMLWKESADASASKVGAVSMVRNKGIEGILQKPYYGSIHPSKRKKHNRRVRYNKAENTTLVFPKDYPHVMQKESIEYVSAATTPPMKLGLLRWVDTNGSSRMRSRRMSIPPTRYGHF